MIFIWICGALVFGYFNHQATIRKGKVMILKYEDAFKMDRRKFIHIVK